MSVSHDMLIAILQYTVYFGNILFNKHTGMTETFIVDEVCSWPKLKLTRYRRAISYIVIMESITYKHSAENT